MKIIIMCGGKQKRFNPQYTKQFTMIDGERIIERTIRLFKDHGDIYIVGDISKFGYLKKTHGVKVIPPAEQSHELSKFMSSYPEWKDEKQVLFLYGDVYFSEGCAQTIKTEGLNDEFIFYGSQWEMFAFRVYGTFFSRLLSAINHIKLLEDYKEGGLCGSWTLYRLLLGKDLLLHTWYTNIIIIDDDSIDFDDEETIHNWLKKYPKHKGELV